MNLPSETAGVLEEGTGAAEGRACSTEPAAALRLSVGQRPTAEPQSAWRCPQGGPGRRSCSERSNDDPAKQQAWARVVCSIRSAPRPACACPALSS